MVVNISIIGPLCKLLYTFYLSMTEYFSVACCQVNEIDFQDSIMVLGFSEEVNKHLLSVR